jgi:CDP-glucose 4,6-dehydratase
VLVTGANGFVGRWLVPALAARGAEVYALVRNGDGNPERPPFTPADGVKLVQGEINDLDFISRLLRDAHMETVFHLAAINTNTGSSISPYDIFETNTRGTYTLLEACRKMPAPVRAVISSSKEVEDCFRPSNVRKHHAYMASKAAAELITRTYADTSGVAAAVVRLENVYGGGDFNWNRLVPGMIRTILRGERPVIRSNGLLERDYVYVEDVVAAFLAVGRQLDQPGVTGQLFRVATGTGTSVLNMVKQIAQQAGRPDLEPQVLNEKSEERVDTFYLPELERKIPGWPVPISLSDGLRQTCRWYQDYFQKLSPLDSGIQPGIIRQP